MTKFYNILGYTIIIISGLLSLYGAWVYVVINQGWDPIIFIFLGPVELALVPFILAFQGHFQLLLITYGGGSLGYFFISTADRLEKKSSDN